MRSGRVAAVVADQVDLDEPGSGVVPVGPGAHRDLTFEQRSRLGGGTSLELILGSLTGQATIDGGRRHRHQQRRGVLIDDQFPEMAQHRHQLGQHRRQPLAGRHSQHSPLQAFPNREGCVVRDESYLHFGGMCFIAGIDADSAARDTIDGLLVICLACTHAAFIPIEDVATTIRCPRCLHHSDLTRERWKLPIEEPQWYYDLHPIARSLLKDNGHVPLLLSQHLRSKSDQSFTMRRNSN